MGRMSDLVNCLIVYHHTITSLTKCFLLRAMFHTEEFEINVRGDNTVIIFLWNVPETTIRQAIVDFEMADVILDRGEGKIKIEAENDAWQVLSERIAHEMGNDTFHIEEEQGVYSVDVAT